MKTIINKNRLFIQLILISGLYLQLHEAKCQDAQFSQFYNAPSILNPSLAGAFNGNIRLQINYKDQWRSISAPYKTFNFSCDMGLLKNKGKTGFLGVGVSFSSDRAGSSQLGLNQANLSIAYHLKISDLNNLSAGLIAGFAQRTIDYSKLQWNSQYDGSNFNPSLPSYETGYSENNTYPDFGAGIEWTHTRGEQYATANDQLFINAGIAVFHFNQPNISFYSSATDNLPTKIIFHGKTQIGLSGTKYSLVPVILYIQQGKQKDIIAGGSIRIKLIEESKYTGFNKAAAISLGGLYRYADAFIPYVQLEFTDYTVGLSYDVNISGLTNATSGRGGFEISLRWINPGPFTGNSASKTPKYFN